MGEENLILSSHSCPLRILKRKSSALAAGVLTGEERREKKGERRGRGRERRSLWMKAGYFQVHNFCLQLSIRGGTHVKDAEEGQSLPSHVLTSFREL